MNILCKLFGHQPSRGYGGKPGTGYLIITAVETDGMGVEHATLNAFCRRCGKEYHVGMVHLPKRAGVATTVRRMTVRGMRI